MHWLKRLPKPNQPTQSFPGTWLATGQYMGFRFVSNPSVIAAGSAFKAVVQLAPVGAGSYRALTGSVTLCPAGTVSNLGD
jgi:hypothetical protein